MKVGDIESTTRGRYVLNTWLVPRMAQILKNGEEVLFVGTDTIWDYKPFFWNPGKTCPYTTLDISSQYHPDIVGDIQNCPQLESNRFSLVIMIGMYEFLHQPEKAFEEILRILKPNGYMLIAFPGRGYFNDDRGVTQTQVYDILKGYRVIEQYNLYEVESEPSSICVLAQKL